ncbi:hypothetical protein CVT24_009295 [Panaeolus cyanescens]|uniref:Glycosyltransferase family 61 protein n=1 Tax=Panaeolus cyanescens TaxID=181874 RepID=A0A409Y886_9AGAR|nr:hypothetical protein CVT24_009295 [Panaeolus cyanescens]
MSRWTAPPERREIVLVLVSILVYLMAYNLESSLDYLGVDPSATKGVILSSMGLGATKDLGVDGRKPAGYRDQLEEEIYGSWNWDEDHVAGEGNERNHEIGSDRHGAFWKEYHETEADLRRKAMWSTVDNALQRWQDNIPQTKLLRHAPGFTIMENVFIAKGNVYIVTDKKEEFPPLSNIVTSTGPGFKRWQILSTEEGKNVLGTYGAPIRGVSFMAADPKSHNTTLLSLWRTYSSLDTTIDATGSTRLPPPVRLIFPHNRFFTDANPPVEEPHDTRRRRFDTGFHPYLAKAAFPQMTVQYLEDWEDYHAMPVPFFFQRLVVADHTAAIKSVEKGQPGYTSAFELVASPHWWQPIRRNLASFVGASKGKRTVTYLSTQLDPLKPKLSDSDHQALVKSLESMAAKHGYEVRVISTETRWIDRMTAIAQSSAVIGVHGNHLMDGLFMEPTPQTVVMELFPAERFSRVREFALKSVGLQYVAWSGKKSFQNTYPPISPPKNDAIEIDPPAIAQLIGDILSQSS